MVLPCDQLTECRMKQQVFHQSYCRKRAKYKKTSESITSSTLRFKIRNSIIMTILAMKPKLLCTSSCSSSDQLKVVKSEQSQLQFLQLKKETCVNAEAIRTKFKWKQQNSCISTWMAPRDHGQATFCPESRRLGQLFITDIKHAVILVQNYTFQEDSLNQCPT